MLNDSSLGQILVVDDEPGIRRVLRRLLSPAGYEVSEAASLAETQAELTAVRREFRQCSEMMGREEVEKRFDELIQKVQNGSPD